MGEVVVKNCTVLKVYQKFFVCVVFQNTKQVWLFNELFFDVFCCFTMAKQSTTWRLVSLSYLLLLMNTEVPWCTSGVGPWVLASGQSTPQCAEIRCFGKDFSPFCVSPQEDDDFMTWWLDDLMTWWLDDLMTWWLDTCLMQKVLGHVHGFQMPVMCRSMTKTSMAFIMVATVSAAVLRVTSIKELRRIGPTIALPFWSTQKNEPCSVSVALSHSESCMQLCQMSHFGQWLCAQRVKIPSAFPLRLFEKKRASKRRCSVLQRGCYTDDELNDAKWQR